MYQSNYQAPVIRQQTLGTEYLVSSHKHKSSEHSLANEPQNSRSSQRTLLPLEPDFSAMSDPIVVINPPSNTWESPNRQTSLNRQSRRDQPKPKLSLRRGEDIDLLHLLPLLVPLCLLTREVRNQRGPDTLKRREEDAKTCWKHRGDMETQNC